MWAYLTLYVGIPAAIEKSSGLACLNRCVPACARTRVKMKKVINKLSSYFPRHKRSDLEKKYEVLEKLGTYVAFL
jgi:hypothetical protein